MPSKGLPVTDTDERMTTGRINQVANLKQTTTSNSQSWSITITQSVHHRVIIGEMLKHFVKQRLFIAA
jgi:hypothetical protein